MSLLIFDRNRSVGTKRHPSLGRLLCLLFGLLLLLIVAPQQNPWTLNSVSSQFLGSETVIQIQVTLLHKKIEFSLYTLTWGTCLLLTGLIISSAQARLALMAFVQNRWIFLVGMILFLALLWINTYLVFLGLVIGLLIVSLLLWSNISPRYLVDTQVFLLRLLTIFIFLFSLKPAPRGWHIVLSLIFSTLGSLFTLIGIQPFLHLLSKPFSILEGIFTSRKSAYLLLTFSFVLIATNLGAYFVFDHMPHVTDSVVQVFQGQIFALGRLVAPTPPLKDFFDFNPLMILQNDKWYSVYPPGHSLLMMLGAFIHAPWLMNPLLGTLTVVLIYFLGAEIYDERTGRLAALLGALSPLLFIMSSGFMNHGSALFHTTLFLLFFAKTVNSRRWYAPILAGTGLGMLINVRPYTALAVAIPVCIYALGAWGNDFRRHLLRLSVLTLVTLCFIGILFSYNYLTNGSPTLFGYVVQFGKAHNPGFGSGPDGKPAHTPQRGLMISLKDLNFLNMRLLGWPIPSLLFVALLFLSGSQNRWDYLLIGLLLFLSLAHFFYWYDVGNSLSPRFLYESCSALIVLTARGILCLPDFARQVLSIQATRSQIKLTSTFVLLLCLIFMLFCRLPAVVHYYASYDFYPHIRPDILKAAESQKVNRAVIFIDPYFYRSVFPANAPLLDGDVVYARDLDQKPRQMAKWVELYPDREFFRLENSRLVAMETPQR